MAEMLVTYKLPKFYSPHSKTPVIFQIIMDTVLRYSVKLIFDIDII